MKHVIIGCALWSFAVFAETEIVNGVEWKYSGSDGKVNIEGIVGDLPKSGELVVPKELGGWPVRSIGGFSGNQKLLSVVVPDGVSLDAITAGAFARCKFLQSVRIQGGVRHIGKNAFGGCERLRSVDAVSGCVRSISCGFQNCYSLEEARFCADAEEICGFSNCYSLRRVEFSRNLRWAGGIFIDCYSVEDVAIPDGPKEISDSFKRCVNLKNVVLPRSVINIDRSFCECMHLKNVVFLGKAPKGLPMHWFYGADVYCYNEHAASYTNANPNLIIRRPIAPLKELCGVAFTNSADFVLLVDRKTAERAKANSIRREALDIQASNALEVVKKLAQSSNEEEELARQNKKQEEERLRQEKEREAERLRQKKSEEEERARQEKERKAEQLRQKKAEDEQKAELLKLKQERMVALDELAGWPTGVASEDLTICGTNNQDVIAELCPGAEGVVLPFWGQTRVSLLPLCEKDLNVVFADVGRWDVCCGMSLIERGDDRWKKYDASGRLVKLAPCQEFPEYVWMTNQHSAITAKLKEMWAKRHGLSLEQAEKRVKELGVAREIPSLMMRRRPLGARRRP